MLAPVRERQAVTVPPPPPLSGVPIQLALQTKQDLGTTSDLLYTLAFNVAYFLEQH